jgi:TrmH family RNA methyltransferase
MTAPLGRNNPLLRRLRRLRRDGTARREDGVLLAEGPHLAEAALASGLEVELALVSPRLFESDEGQALYAALLERGIECHQTAPDLLDSVQDARSPQPILLLVRRPLQDPEAALSKAGCLAVVLAGIQDPGNLGGIVRSAEAAGAALCLVGEGCADPFHPRAVRASSGSLLRLPLVVESNAAIVERLRARGLRLTGSAARRGDLLDDADLRGALALCFGGEGAGLPQELERALDAWVQIPIAESVESLSVGAAAAVLLFEAARQRR